MAESIIIPGVHSTKTERYELLLPQLHALADGKADVIANTANLMAALKEAMGFFWVGIYFARENELVLGPFQGPVACTRIGFGKGVCGTAWQKQKTIVVKDVDEFPGHIACSSLSRSEIVLPIFKNNKVAAVLDVDSAELAAFDETDEKYLQKVVVLIESLL